ncbi:hypothetical protein [Sphingomonas sp. Leaf25]|uniref:hypothetical protein n=1 Tax=Sphingomonas sp. Leaf25 TaxID=1735692 RepID=UPI0006FBD210|nr:hypothetical protein [Sphingomonas sp. Leaf25]KQM98753.1 hypothetical protein ASE78_05870 [Sphingomonas sp. Leaf25]
MPAIIKRALSALNPWYNWGAVSVERLDAVSEDHGSESDVRFFDLQWFGLHLSVQVGRQPPKATPAQIASRAQYRREAAERAVEREQRREAWKVAHKAQTDARACLDALPFDHPDEVAVLEAWLSATARLIEDTPAPNGKALAIKVELATSDDIPLAPGWGAAIAADARRLHAEGF